ncbi:NUDIX hydrolase [Leeuwenhoekiella sp. UBA6783]|uniref:NUDIX hydrolase n=1 Tax=Leeuwenhoekiella sp. UBA6783 TaxID=1946747 RepID=UPI0025C209B3|nr:NUDIX domain-containing protein [Leeuwenhoekiella sp. UBA6783]|tara:strand:+ start:1214 stop:1921 length:708 start_codon:yes stop_codon:yes gene_type:complete
MNYEEFLRVGHKYFIPHLSTDLVIIAYHEDKLKCLLLRTADEWMLPGGFIGMEESVDAAVERVLRSRTGLTDPHLRFLSVFGDSSRAFGDVWKSHFERAQVTWNPDYWINKRFVTLTYYSLVNYTETQPVIQDFDEEFGWFAFDELPKITMDHEAILRKARQTLKEEVSLEHLSYNLLPEKFTMPQLHQLHQHILEENIDRSRFQKKMLASGLFKRLPKLKKDTPGRNPYLYTKI